MPRMLAPLLASLPMLLVCGGVTFAVASVLRDEPRPVYLAIGDDGQVAEFSKLGHPEAASELFRKHLSDSTGKRVILSVVPHADRTSSFIYDENGLEAAVRQLRSYKREGRRVVAITLRVGYADLLTGLDCAFRIRVDAGADGDRWRCNLNLEDEMEDDLHEILARLKIAKDASTPVFIATFHNPEDCGNRGTEGTPTEALVVRWNQLIGDMAERHGAFIVDTYEPFRGLACDYADASGEGLNAVGMAALAELYRTAYESLPREGR